MPFLSKEPKRPPDKASAEDITCHDEEAKGLRLRTISKRITADSIMPWKLFFAIQSSRGQPQYTTRNAPTGTGVVCQLLLGCASVDWRWVGFSRSRFEKTEDSCFDFIGVEKLRK
jgi:hypothetical protein